MEAVDNLPKAFGLHSGGTGEPQKTFDQRSGKKDCKKTDGHGMVCVAGRQAV